MKTFIRALIHFPVGVFVAWLSVQNAPLALIMGFSFLTYEVIEDWRIEDRSYKDIFGYLFGLGAGGILW